MSKECRYCSFSSKECVNRNFEDICPLTKVDDPLAECWDVECSYYEDACDYCIAYQEG